MNQTKKNMFTNPDGTVTLCGRRKCCPILREIDNENITITDDDGNVVTMKKEQALLIGDGVNLLEKERRALNDLGISEDDLKILND